MAMKVRVVSLPVLRKYVDSTISRRTGATEESDVHSSPREEPGDGSSRSERTRDWKIEEFDGQTPIQVWGR